MSLGFYQVVLGVSFVQNMILNFVQDGMRMSGLKQFLHSLERLLFSSLHLGTEHALCS